MDGVRVWILEKESPFEEGSNLAVRLGNPLVNSTDQCSEQFLSCCHFGSLGLNLLTINITRPPCWGHGGLRMLVGCGNVTPGSPELCCPSSPSHPPCWTHRRLRKSLPVKWLHTQQRKGWYRYHLIWRKLSPKNAVCQTERNAHPELGGRNVPFESHFSVQYKSEPPGLLPCSQKASNGCPRDPVSLKARGWTWTLTGSPLAALIPAWETCLFTRAHCSVNSLLWVGKDGSAGDLVPARISNVWHHKKDTVRSSC